MSLERQILYWAIALAALGYGLHLLGSSVTPFAAGIALGYLLDPVVSKMETLGFNRLGASLLILVVFAAAVIVALIVVAPILSNQFLAFAERLPGYAMRLQALALDEGNLLIEKYGGGWTRAFGYGEPISSSQIQRSVGDFVAQGAQWLVDGLKSLVSGGAAVFSFLSLLIVTPVVAFYILIDWHRMIAEIDSWLPLDHRDRLRAVAKEINHALAGFIRGQSLVCLFLGLWYGLGLTLIGLDFGLLIGVLGGVLSFVPYVGSLTALVLSLGVALVQGWPNLKLLLDGARRSSAAASSLRPMSCRRNWSANPIGLHPVWLMFALLAFGELFGFVGLVVAVPTAAAIGVLVRHVIAMYLASSLYRGHSAAEGQ